MKLLNVQFYPISCHFILYVSYGSLLLFVNSTLSVILNEAHTQFRQTNGTVTDLSHLVNERRISADNVVPVRIVTCNPTLVVKTASTLLKALLVTTVGWPRFTIAEMSVSALCKGKGTCCVSTSRSSTALLSGASLWATALLPHSYHIPVGGITGISRK
jgi:hypothetical protein